MEKETGLRAEDDPKALWAAAEKNWLTRSARSTFDRIRAREDGHIWFGLDISERDGTEETFLVPVEILYPISKWDGHLLGRIDYVSIDTGDVDYIDRPSLNPLTTQRVEFQEKDTGIALGIGWRAEDWSVDVGTTPLGFRERTWVGGVGLSGDVGDVGWTLDLSRRPEVGTLLSYGGMEVPSDASGFQGTEWGGVVRTGGKLGLSYDLGGKVGYWGSLQAHQLTGQGRVEDNDRFGVLGGVYWRAKESVPHNIQVGVNLMHLQYDKNLINRGLDNAGYFSPQNYVSVSLPVRYFGRSGHDFSYMVGASVSHSWSREDEPFGYGEGSSSSKDFGFTVEAAVEKRISDHWYLGAAADIQRADFYEPNHFVIYARYTFKDRWSPVPTPPEPPIPYSDFD
nr:cellulose synthase subunit BcsC-related outer membrane protein [Litorivivens lipolytica]